MVCKPIRRIYRIYGRGIVKEEDLGLNKRIVLVLSFFTLWE